MRKFCWHSCFGDCFLRGSPVVRIWALVAVIIVASAVECRAIEDMLPRSFQGLWVDVPDHDACSQVKVPRDTRGAGEGALFLDGKMYFSQETECSDTIASKSCCNAENEDTRGGTLVCGKNRYPVIFHLRKTSGKVELIVATHTLGVSGPSLRTYQRCKLK